MSQLAASHEEGEGGTKAEEDRVVEESQVIRKKVEIRATSRETREEVQEVSQEIKAAVIAVSPGTKEEAMIAGKAQITDPKATVQIRKASKEPHVVAIEEDRVTEIKARETKVRKETIATTATIATNAT